MPFVFSLAAVAAVRAERERQAERALTAILQEIAATRQSLQAIESELRRAAADHLTDPSRHHTGFSLHEAYAHLALLRTAREELLAQLQLLASRREQLQGAYLAAHRDRDLLDTLEQAQRSAHRAAEATQESKRNDELFLARLRQR